MPCETYLLSENDKCVPLHLEIVILWPVGHELLLWASLVQGAFGNVPGLEHLEYLCLRWITWQSVPCVAALHRKKKQLPDISVEFPLNSFPSAPPIFFTEHNVKNLL